MHSIAFADGILFAVRPMAIEDAMLYDNLWGIAELADWRLMNFEYNALAVAVFVVAAILIWNSIRIWKRTQRIETELSKIEKKINILELHESRRLIVDLNANSKRGIDPCDMAAEMDDNDVAVLTVLPPSTPAKREIAKSAKLRG